MRVSLTPIKTIEVFVEIYESCKWLKACLLQEQFIFFIIQGAKANKLYIELLTNWLNILKVVFLLTGSMTTIAVSISYALRTVCLTVNTDVKERDA